LNRKQVVGWVILVFAVPFWVIAISSASGHGFFENEFAVQSMIMGGAVSMIAGLFLWYEY
jgi:hypothetical protein